MMSNHQVMLSAPHKLRTIAPLKTLSISYFFIIPTGTLQPDDGSALKTRILFVFKRRCLMH